MAAIFKKILCPIELDRIAIPALELAIKIAAQSDATIILMSVIPQGQPSTPEADLRRVATDSLRGVGRKWLEGKFKHEIAVRMGDPVDAILKAEDEFDADLVVMSTHGRTGERREKLGSVTERVVRLSTKPVLTIRPE